MKVTQKERWSKRGRKVLIRHKENRWHLSAEPWKVKVRGRGRDMCQALEHSHVYESS